MSTLAILGGTPVRREPLPMRRTMGDEEKRAVMRVMDSDKLSGFFGSPGDGWLGGPEVRGFEDKWASRYGFRSAITVNSWTTGLMAAVGAIGISPGDEVIVSPYTMSASATAILFYGGIPIFADVDAQTYNITAETIRDKITPRTKAIMVVHIFGQAAEMDAIVTLAGQHDLKVIEDAAQAPGIKYRDRYVGAIGDIGGFSLNYHKHIHTGEGGVLVTNDPALATRCQLIRNHGENLVDFVGVDDWTNMIGSNYRLTELCAAIGNEQLDKLPGLLAHRQRLAEHLSRRLAAVPGITPPKVAEGSEHAYYLYPFTIDTGALGISRSAFVKAVNAEFPTAGHWEQTVLVEGYVQPLYLAPLYQRKIALGRNGFPWQLNAGETYDYSKGICPNVERLHDNDLVYTPMVREPLTIGEMDQLADAIEKVVAGARSIASHAA